MRIQLLRNWSRTVAILLVILLGTVPGLAEDRENIQSLFNKGQKLLNGGDPRGAVTVFRELQAACKRDDAFCSGVAAFHLGKCYSELAEHDHATEQLKKSVEYFHSGDHAREKGVALGLLGWVSAERSDFNGARK